MLAACPRQQRYCSGYDFQRELFLNLGALFISIFLDRQSRIV